METFTRIFAGAAAAAMIGSWAPAAAQPYPMPYGYNSGMPGGAYGYNGQYQMAVSQCSSAVNQRLGGGYANGAPYGVAGAYGTPAGGRVVGITHVDTHLNGYIRVKGVASSGYGGAGAYGPGGGYGGPYAGYSGYGGGYGGYGGYAGAPDMSFKCDIDYRGYIRDIHLEHRH